MIRKTRLHVLLTAVVGCVALLLGACGGDGGGDPAPAAESAGPTGGATGEPVPGGEAYGLMIGEPRSLDPALIGNAYAATPVLGNALYGTLMIDNEDGEIEYRMAESFTTDDGGATFTLRLRPNLVFSDGTPLNAEAVKFNWDRIKDPATGSAYRPEASMVASTEVVDDLTLKVTMVEPVPRYAQTVLTTAMNWIASPAALRQGQAAFDENPVGAGPFTLESWTRQAEIRLVKNPKYWDAPKPYLDRLTIRAAVEATQRYNTVLTGGADVAIESSWVNLDRAAEAGLSTDILPINGGLFMAMNTRRPPFDDIRARQAVAAAIDLEAVNQAVYNGVGKPADTLFSESSPFYSDTPLHRTDRATAQRLFEELAAEGKPVSFTFTSFPSSENRAVAENVQAQLSAFDNVKVEIKVVETAELGRLRATHEFDVLVTSAFFQDPEPRLWTVFSSGSAANLSGVADPALDEALLTGRTAASEQERKAAYDTVQQRLAALTPVVFLQRVALGAVAGRNVGGLAQYGNGSLLPEELWIQQ